MAFAAIVDPATSERGARNGGPSRNLRHPSYDAVVDVRIGVTYSPKELELEVEEGMNADQLRSHIESALSDDDNVLWLTDRKGRQVGVPASKVAYVEIGSPQEERRIGFGGG